jgi:hypothetical protein
MNTVNTDEISATHDGDPVAVRNDDDSVDELAVASIAMSALGFVTLFRLAHRKDRTPARALGLLCATSLASVSGTVLSLAATSHASDSEQPGKGLVLGASGAVLGIITTLLNFNWMRTKRHL